MSAKREELHSKFIELLESNNVYYKPPANVRMSYPAIRYDKSRFDVKYADDKIYSKMTCYELTVISKSPDHPVIDKLMEMPYCSYDRHYVADNMDHDVLTIYY